MALCPGDQLGPYEILSPIGAGGMGEVYRARDTRLDRIVALKILKGEHGARFEQEARAIAALNHPHICQIYDVGPDYLVMEYVDGQPLRGPVPMADALRLAMQLAGALEEAHARGILHLDLKPENILVTRNGTAKLLDFGLAKMSRDIQPPDVTQTVQGVVVGTPAYMAPEQAQGQPLDQRSDIFSFGAVLYELLSGRRAFDGRSLLDTLNAVVSGEPAALQSPAALVVRRCLAKQAAERFQSMAELRKALEQIGTKPNEPKPSVAVLPFANMSLDKEQEFFSDGLTEEILNLLAHISGLKVIARTSSFAVKGKNEDIRKIAEILGVRTILEGSVRRSGNRIRVTAQLINAEDGSHLWSERYDREMTDIFALQDEIAAAIAGALKLKFTAKARHTPNLDAHEAYLRGQSLASSATVDSFKLARKCYEQAIALDPEYAEPHTALAIYHAWMNFLGAVPPREAAGPWRAACERALEIDPSSASAHAYLAGMIRAYDFDWRKAERHLEIALTADAVPAEVHYMAALHDFCLGRFPKAIRAMEACLEKDPLDGRYNGTFVYILDASGSRERAHAEIRRTIEIDPNSWMAYYFLSHLHSVAGKTQEAIHAAEEAARLAPLPANVGTLAGLLHEAGHTQRAQELLERLRTMPDYSVAVGMLPYHLIGKELGAAAECYERIIEYRHIQATLWINLPWMGPLRASAYWPRLARMMNLPDSA